MESLFIPIPIFYFQASQQDTLILHANKCMFCLIGSASFHGSQQNALSCQPKEGSVMLIPYSYFYASQHHALVL